MIRALLGMVGGPPIGVNENKRRAVVVNYHETKEGETSSMVNGRIIVYRVLIG